MEEEAEPVDLNFSKQGWQLITNSREMSEKQSAFITGSMLAFMAYAVVNIQSYSQFSSAQYLFALAGVTVLSGFIYRVLIIEFLKGVAVLKKDLNESGVVLRTGTLASYFKIIHQACAFVFFVWFTVAGYLYIWEVTNTADTPRIEYESQEEGA